MSIVTIANLKNHNTKRDEITCVQLSRKTRDELARMGHKSDTFEDVIRTLIEKSESNPQSDEDDSDSQ